MAELTLDPEAVQEIIRGSILNAITEEARQNLIEGAIKYLMTPPSSQYGTRQAPLTEVFNQAVHNATREIIYEEFKNNPQVIEAINEVVHPMIVKLCDHNYEGLPEAIGTAFAGWLQSQKQYT